jgi:hypothetical protein
MVYGSSRNKVVAVWQTAFAALIGIRRRNAVALGAAVCCLTIKGPTCETIERPNEQDNRDESNREVKAAPHSSQHSRSYDGHCMKGTFPLPFMQYVVCPQRVRLI